ncbi:hypothetical protein D4764_17G0005730 [Takifugu flavidus]|uniref:Uncharacterized protein n=1 Tax=Takifugu flavidus TaxID=433684 RepID=A0A5C6NYT4_9TELE|nr:hypothetical protein D4764_17G0005730 [Takifugu flavidus]
MIDFVVVSSDLRSHVLDTRVKRGAELSTDHHLVVSWLQWWGRMPDRPSRPKRIVRVCWERLAESPVRRSFNSHLRESFDHVPGEAGDKDPGMGRVRRLRRGKLCTVNAVYSGDGVLLTSTRDVVDWWKEYFEDLLNPTNTPSSPGVDEIRPEFLKALDVVGLSWLTRLCNIVWTSGTVPLDWQLDADQLYTFSRVFEGAWEFAQPVHMCFVDLEKAVRSLYDQCQGLVRIAGMEEFKYLGVLFTSERRMEQEIDRRSVVVKRELSRKAKLSIYRSIFVPTLTYGHELWVMTKRTRSRVQAAEMSFLRRVAGLSLRDRDAPWTPPW